MYCGRICKLIVSHVYTFMQTYAYKHSRVMKGLIFMHDERAYICCFNFRVNACMH